MGKSMLKQLKTKAEFLMETLGDKLNTDFENNKQIIRSLNLPLSKTDINKIAGYIVRIKKREKKEAN